MDLRSLGTIVGHEIINRVSYLVCTMECRVANNFLHVQMRSTLFMVYESTPREKGGNARSLGTITGIRGRCRVYPNNVEGGEYQPHTTVPSCIRFGLCVAVHFWCLREEKQGMGRLHELAAWSLITFSTHSTTDIAQTQHSMNTLHCSTPSVASRTEIVLVTPTCKAPE